MAGLQGFVKAKEEAERLHAQAQALVARRAGALHRAEKLQAERHRRAPIPPLHLPYISPASPLHLPCISQVNHGYTYSDPATAPTFTFYEPRQVKGLGLGFHLLRAPPGKGVRRVRVSPSSSPAR